MSEYWKSTPKYWCKHCGIFVRDTKLERTNHEATGKHQGALKRFLRDLHRGHEREERDKDRAKREIERLNGVVSGSSGSGGASSSGYKGGPSSSTSTAPPTPSTTQLSRQREELAALGVSMPTEFRGEMAMAGEWTVTNTRIIQDDEDTTKDKSGTKVEAKATGIRKREVTEEQREEEEAVRGLFKKQRTWGGTRAMPEGDGDLDALLSGNTLLLPPKKEQIENDATSSSEIKQEKDEADPETKTENPEDAANIKQEPTDEDDANLEPESKPYAPSAPADVGVKTEEGATPGGEGPAPVVFKKRKPKNIRQK